MRRPRSDVHVADIQSLEAPVEARLEFGAVVGLDHLDAEREPPQDLVQEADGRSLIARVVNLEHANPGAVIDRGELIQPFARARNTLEKFDVDLQTMPRLRLLVPRP